jgi:hypothetical protein
MKKTAIMCLLFLSTLTKAQTNSKTSNVYITFSPLSIIDINSYLRAGVLYDLNEKNSIELELGYGKNFTSKKYSRSQARLSYRHYMSSTKQDARFYYFAEGFYNNRNNTLDSFQYVDKNEKINYYDSSFNIRFDRGNQIIEKLGANIGLGLFIQLSNHFYLDLFTGFGLASRNVSYKNEINKQSIYLYRIPKEWFDNTRFVQPNNLSVFSMKCGVDLVYKF